MSTLILLFSIITQGSNPSTDPAASANTVANTQISGHMRYHGVEKLLAKFEAEAAQNTPG